MFTWDLLKSTFKRMKRKFTAERNIRYMSFDITVMNTFYEYLRNKPQQKKDMKSLPTKFQT